MAATASTNEKEDGKKKKKSKEEEEEEEEGCYSVNTVTHRPDGDASCLVNIVQPPFVFLPPSSAESLPLLRPPNFFFSSQQHHLDLPLFIISNRIITFLFDIKPVSQLRLMSTRRISTVNTIKCSILHQIRAVLQSTMSSAVQRMNTTHFWEALPSKLNTQQHSL